MDPNLMKFLKDETMHSGANSSSSDSNGASQFLPQWPTSLTGSAVCMNMQEDTEQLRDQQSMLQCNHPVGAFTQKEEDVFSHEFNSLHVSNPLNNFAVSQPMTVAMQSSYNEPSIGNPDMAATQNTGMGMSGTTSVQQPGGTTMRNKQVPFSMLLPILQPQLDRDMAMQLHTLYLKLKKNEITKDDFVRHMRSIVGDQMLKMAVYKLQEQRREENGI